MAKSGAVMIGISEDPTMWVVERLALKAAACRANILLEGESGVGKAFIARQIHQASSVIRKGFFTLFCLPGSDSRADAYSLADDLKNRHDKYGTIYLRGVDLLSGINQRELLGYLDEREREFEAYPLTRARYARLIFSSQKNLRLEVERGYFLRQLYLRVSVVTIEVPPLRQRETDIVSLANHFLNLYAHRECKTIRGMSADAQHLLRHLSWEGNIHELKNTMNHAVVMADDGVVLSAGILRGVLAQAYG